MDTRGPAHACHSSELTGFFSPALQMNADKSHYTASHVNPYVKHGQNFTAIRRNQPTETSSNAGKMNDDEYESLQHDEFSDA
jgi:hypothetical protein